MELPGFIKWGFGLVAASVVVYIAAANNAPNSMMPAHVPYIVATILLIVGALALTRPIWRRKLAERAARR